MSHSSLLFNIFYHFIFPDFLFILVSVRVVKTCLCFFNVELIQSLINCQYSKASLKMLPIVDSETLGNKSNVSQPSVLMNVTDHSHHQACKVLLISTQTLKILVIYKNGDFLTSWPSLSIKEEATFTWKGYC